MPSSCHLAFISNTAALSRAILREVRARYWGLAGCTGQAINVLYDPMSHAASLKCIILMLCLPQIEGGRESCIGEMGRQGGKEMARRREGQNHKMNLTAGLFRSDFPQELTFAALSERILLSQTLKLIWVRGEYALSLGVP